jgi:hypothetical protein
MSFAAIKLLCCFSTSVYFCRRIYRYRLSPETFGYTLVRLQIIKITRKTSAVICDKSFVRDKLKEDSVQIQVPNVALITILDLF